MHLPTAHLPEKTFFVKKPVAALGIVVLLLLGAAVGYAQGDIRIDNRGRPMRPGSQGADSLEQRDRNEDSITIYFRMFDSSRIRFIDSSISDGYMRFGLSPYHLFLNQYSGAARSVLFQPHMTPGYDPGFHGYDAYHFNLQNTRFFNTTRPYTEIDYILGSKAEQTIKVLHTQNVKPLWNFSFEYRLINVPGHFKSSAGNHTNLRFASDFSGKSRRYSGLVVAIRNRTKVNENGGLENDSFLTSSNPAYFERFNIPTMLGQDGAFSTNFLTSNLTTGADYYTHQVYFRHQYDIGKKEVTYSEDSVKTQKFYPRLRLQHNLQILNRGFTYVDANYLTAEAQAAYRNHFGLTNTDSVGRMTDRWREITNEGAVIFFPEKNNLEQFVKIGAAFQWLRGWFAGLPDNFNGTYLLGEYRNRTRNRKWDINANGNIFLTGPYSGNYNVQANLQTNFGPGGKSGSLLLGFQNANRTPSFVFNAQSNFYLKDRISLNAENWTALSADMVIRKYRVSLKARYYLVANYTYWNDFYTATQDGTLQNILKISAEKVFQLNKRWKWYAEMHVQQSSSPGINLPLLFTRNRLAYEGNFYKNLHLSTGLEFRYFTPFTADTWSPFNGQWVVQQNTRIKNTPDVAGFLHIRINSFRGFFRVENLNTFSLSNGFNFTNNNLAAPLYANPGLITRIGIYWSFVN